MKFKLEIKLGNAEMQTPDNIAEALEEAAHRVINRLDQYEPITSRSIGTSGVILDLNGAHVGEWKVMR